MSDEQHVTLAAALHKLKGAVLLSGYRCNLYDDLYRDWHRIDQKAHADGALDRIESLWFFNNAQRSQMEIAI